MAGTIDFDPNLYRGTAQDYERFRVPYPQAMIDEVLDRAQASGEGRLMDLACGTGQIAFAVASRFAEVWAVDQEPDMIEAVRGKAQAAGTTHVRTIISTAESLHARLRHSSSSRSAMRSIGSVAKRSRPTRFAG